VVRGGPAASASPWPIKAIVAARRQRGVRGGLVHGPSLPEQALRCHPSLARDTMSEAIALAAEVSVTTRREVRAGGGQTH
jgi:pyroglutamyl-peptidase